APSTLLRPLTTPLTTQPSRSPKLLPIEHTPSTAFDAMLLMAEPILPGNSFALSTILLNKLLVSSQISSKNPETPVHIDFAAPTAFSFMVVNRVDTPSRMFDAVFLVFV